MMKFALTVLFVALFAVQSYAAVDCQMARSMAAGYSRAQLASMGTKEQRAQYAHCFKRSHGKRKVKR